MSHFAIVVPRIAGRSAEEESPGSPEARAKGCTCVLDERGEMDLSMPQHCPWCHWADRGIKYGDWPVTDGKS